MTEDLKAFGYPAAEIERAVADFLAAAAPVDAFLVFGPNAAAVRLFLAMRTQWRTASLSTMGRAQVVKSGLDYGVLKTTADLEGLSLTPDDFQRIRLLEGEALEAWAEQRAASR